MKNTDLENRVSRFKKIFNKEDLVHPLIASIKLKSHLFEDIKNSSLAYLSSVLGEGTKNNFDQVISNFQQAESGLKNVTPTGMVLPKINTSLEYNLLLRSYYKALREEYFFEKFSFCHTPAHLRVKWPTVKYADLNRPRHAPEEMHFDSWSGYSSHGVTLLLGVLGDVENNRVNFYSPNDHFQEKWLIKEHKPQEKELLRCYSQIDFIPPEGYLVLLDTAVLHQTYREQKADIRFSIDNIFIPKLGLDSVENIEYGRRLELTDPNLLCNLGSECLYFCDQNEGQIKDSRGGSIDPTSFKFISLKG